MFNVQRATFNAQRSKYKDHGITDGEDTGFDLLEHGLVVGRTCVVQDAGTDPAA